MSGCGLWVWQADRCRLGALRGVPAILALARALDADRLLIKVLDGTRRLNVEAWRELLDVSPCPLIPWAWPRPRRGRDCSEGYLDEQAQILGDRATEADGIAVVDVEADWSYSASVLRSAGGEGLCSIARVAGNRLEWGGSARKICDALWSRAERYLQGLADVQIELSSFPRPIFHSIDYAPWLRCVSRVLPQCYYPRPRGWDATILESVGQWATLIARYGVGQHLRYSGPAFRGLSEVKAMARAVAGVAVGGLVEPDIDWWSAQHLRSATVDALRSAQATGSQPGSEGE